MSFELIIVMPPALGAAKNQIVLIFLIPETILYNTYSTGQKFEYTSF